MKKKQKKKKIDTPQMDCNILFVMDYITFRRGMFASTHFGRQVSRQEPEWVGEWGQFSVWAIK
jgi:hypothetical protein